MPLLQSAAMGRARKPPEPDEQPAAAPHEHLHAAALAYGQVGGEDEQAPEHRPDFPRGAGSDDGREQAPATAT